VPSLTKLLDCASKIAFTCLSTLLIACEPLIFGGISGLGGSSSFTVAQCANSLPADLSGACRNTSAPTPGALEAVGAGSQQIASIQTANIFPTIQQNTGTTSLNITWSPYTGTPAGYFVYYGPSVDTATILASDLPIGIANFNPSAPSISYDASMDLGLNTGNSVCFRVLAYDFAHVSYDWSIIQCTVV
jgi:hypothetical protein